MGNASNERHGPYLGQVMRNNLEYGASFAKLLILLQSIPLRSERIYTADPTASTGTSIRIASASSIGNAG